MGTITKALDLLSYFSANTPELGLSEFVKQSGRDKATVHRHLTELAENGFLEQHPVTRTYRLGPAFLRYASLREATVPTRRLVIPIIDKLAAEAGELMHLSLLQGQALSPVYHADPRLHGTQVFFDEAELLPLHATSSGLTALAFMDDAFIKKVLSRKLEAHTAHTETDPDKIKAWLKDIRQSGYGTAAQGFDEEVTSQAVPIFGPEGTVTGAVAIAVPNARFTEQKSRDIRSVLAKAFREIHRSLGGVVPPAYAGKWSADV